MVGLLVGLLLCGLFDWLVGYLSCWLVGWLRWLDGWLVKVVGWLVGLLLCGLVGFQSVILPIYVVECKVIYTSQARSKNL